MKDEIYNMQFGNNNSCHDVKMFQVYEIVKHFVNH